MNNPIDSLPTRAASWRAVSRFSIGDILWCFALLAGSIGYVRSFWVAELPMTCVVFAGISAFYFVLPFFLDTRNCSRLACKLGAYGIVGLLAVGFTIHPFQEPAGLLFLFTTSAFVLLALRSKKFARPRIMIRIASLILFASTALGLYLNSMKPPPRTPQSRLLELRQQNPLVNLSDRLSRIHSPNKALPGNSLDLSESTVTDLEFLESWFDQPCNDFWEQQLKDFHDPAFEEKTRALAYRIQFKGLRSLSRPRITELGIVPFSTAPPSRNRDKSVDDGLSSGERGAMRALNAVKDTFEADYAISFPETLSGRHLKAIADFCHPSGLGHSPAPKQAYGLIAHGFHFPFEKLTYRDFDFELLRLELISLSKGQSPRGFELIHLPRMDQISGGEARTRRTDEFETAALAKLNKGEMIVIESGDDVLRMVGAIRAIDNCKSCHDVPRGEMLGAFSYFWQRQ